MANVVFDKVFKHYSGNVTAITDLNLEVRDKEFMVLVGPSGCGKSTALRMIAGLEDISEGTVSIGGRVVNNVAPKDRDIAMVFQNYALYPHMNVFDNMAFALKLRRMPRDQIKTKVEAVADSLGIKHLLARKPRALSGGQRQRVALGRAIVREPQVFLMDEPLSNLDAKMRVQTRAELNKLHQRLQTTTVYVTHDQVEAMTMGDRIAVMKDGLLQQVDTPHNLFTNPTNMFVAGFIGSPAMNLVTVHVTQEGESVMLATDSTGEDSGLKLKVPSRYRAQITPYSGKDIIFGLRPQDIHDARFAQGMLDEDEDPADLMPVRARVDVVEPMGSEVYLYLVNGQNTFVARMDARTEAQPDYVIDVAFNMDKMHAFDPETQQSLLENVKSAQHG
ncbi:MAG TPA: sn-glycerol-3-phosphate ABC transporter ATP-binding protein UgpC [Chloroflexia bacterium]|nr:sn-glycerol-3-phosphate ABC transporter ATP-binding protein UgpC [Chloroflexia bacterium]